jgi:hypothetical protein
MSDKTIYRLCYLAVKKNEANRERRRAYAYRSKLTHGELVVYVNGEALDMAGSKNKLEAEADVKLAIKKRKSFTYEMREIRKEIGARIEHGTSGNIRHIEHNEAKLDKDKMQEYHDWYLAEKEILK